MVISRHIGNLWLVEKLLSATRRIGDRIPEWHMYKPAIDAPVLHHPEQLGRRRSYGMQA